MLEARPGLSPGLREKIDVMEEPAPAEAAPAEAVDEPVVAAEPTDGDGDGAAATAAARREARRKRRRTRPHGRAR